MSPFLDQLDQEVRYQVIKLVRLSTIAQFKSIQLSTLDSLYIDSTDGFPSMLGIDESEGLLHTRWALHIENIFCFLKYISVTVDKSTAGKAIGRESTSVGYGTFFWFDLQLHILSCKF